MIEKNKKYIETTIRIFESYGVYNMLLENIADAYNKIAEREIKENHLIKLPLLNKNEGDNNNE